MNWFLKTRLGGWLLIKRELTKRKRSGTANGRSYQDYLYVVAETFSKLKDARLGQVAFNVLMEWNPDLAETVRSSAVDPFYCSARLPEFFAHIEKFWITPRRYLPCQKNNMCLGTHRS